MATKKVLVEINVEQKGNSISKTTKEVDKLTAATEKLANEQSNEAKELAKVNFHIQKQREANKNFAKEQFDLASSIENTTGAMQEMKTTSGLTGAIVTELGRTASDSAYGIRGMGNNISQIVTLFGQLQVNVAKAGGTMKDSFNQIFQSMKGIIGVMTGIQIVLGVIQAEWFQKWLSGLFSVNTALKTNIELMKEASDIAGASVGKFKVYISLLNDEATEQSERLEIVKKLNEEYPEFNANLYNNTERTKEQIEAEKDYIKLLKQRAKSEAAIQKFQEAQGKLIDLESQRDLKIAPIQEEINKIKELGAFTALSTNQVNAIIKDGYTTREEISNQAIRLKNNEILQIEKNAEKEISSAEKVAKSYEKYFDASGIGGGSDPSRRGSTNTPLKAFKQGRLLLNKEEARYLKERESLNKRTEEQIISDEREARDISVDITLEEFKEKQKIRLDTYLATKKLTDDQREQAKKDYEESIKLAEDEAERVIKAIQSVETEKQRLREERQARDEKDRQDELTRTQEQQDAGLLSGFEGGAQAQIDADEAEYQRKVAYYEREIELETVTTERKKQLRQEMALLNIQRNSEELDGEIALVNEKARINMEYVGYVKSIGGILASLAGESKELQIASLAIEKGAAIAGVTIEASKSISTRIAKNAALTPILQAADSPFLAKDITRTKVSAGLAIASITATGINQASNINGGGGSSGGGNTTVQPPDFNIVGSTGVNQLADAIGSTETPIVKAVVVASEVTTQQALDRNTRKSAEL